MPLAVKNINFNYECGALASAGLNWCLCESVGFGRKGMPVNLNPAKPTINNNHLAYMSAYHVWGYTPELGAKCVSVSHSSLGAFGVSSILYCVPSGRTAKVIPTIHNIQFVNGVYGALKYCANWYSACFFSANTPLTCTYIFGPGGCIVGPGRMYSSSLSSSGCQRTDHYYMAEAPSMYSNTGHFCLTVGEPTVLGPYNAVCGSFSAATARTASAVRSSRGHSSQNTIGLNSWECAEGQCAAVVMANYTGLTGETGAYAPALINYVGNNSKFSCYQSKEPVKATDLQPYFYLQAGDCIAIDFCTNMSMCAGALLACYSVRLLNVERVTDGLETWCNAETNMAALAGHYAKVQLNYIIIEEASS